MLRPSAGAARGCARGRAGAGAGRSVPGRAPVGRRGDANRRRGVGGGAGRARGHGATRRRDHGARGRQAAAPHRRAHAHRARRHSARGAPDGRMGHRRRHQPVGHVSRAAAQHARDAAGGGGQERRPHRRVRQRRLPAGARAAGLRQGDGRDARRVEAAGRDRAQDPQGPGPGLSGGRPAAPAAGRRPRARPAVREGGRAGHADRDPHRRSQGVLEAGQRPTTSAGTSCRRTPSGRSTASRCRRGSSSTTRSSGAWRGTRRATSSPCTSATTRRTRSASRRCSTSTPTSISTPRRACPRSGRHPADRMRQLLREVPGPHPVRHRHRRGREPGRHDVRLERRQRRRRAPTRCASSRRPGATSRRSTASSRARRPIQGRWKIDGVGLPESILRKVYFDNAAKLLRWKPNHMP